MKRFYIAAYFEGNRAEYTEHENSEGEYIPGFCASVLECSESTNIVSYLEKFEGLKGANIIETKKKAIEIVDEWNNSFKKNGTYLFD